MGGKRSSFDNTWVLKYESNKRGITPVERLEMAKDKASQMKMRGWDTKIKRAKKGNLIYYELWIK